MTKALTKQDRPKYLSGYSKYACLIHKIDTFYALIGKKKNSASFFLKTKLVEGSNFDILDRYQILQPWKRVLIFLFPMPFLAKAVNEHENGDMNWQWMPFCYCKSIILAYFRFLIKKRNKKSYISISVSSVVEF